MVKIHSHFSSMNKHLLFFLLGLTPYLILSLFFHHYDSLIHPKVYYKLIFTAIIILVFVIRKSVFYRIESSLTLTFVSVLIFVAFVLNTGFIKLDNDNYTNGLIVKSISALSTGFFEETLFRFLLFIGLIKQFERHDYKKLIQIAIWTSLIFSLMHVFNLLNGLCSFQSSVNQIVVAFGLGFLLQSLFVRFRSLFLVSVLHGLLNFIGTFDTVIQNNETVENFAPSNYWHFNWLSFLFVVIFTAFVCFLAYLIFPEKKKIENGLSIAILELD